MNFKQFRARYNYDPKQPIGEGGFGKVFKAMDTLTKTVVALKMIPVKAAFKQFTLQNEFKLVKNLQHPHIVKYLSCEQYDTDTGLNEFAVLEYCKDGDLEAMLQKRPLTPAELEDFTKGILSGVQHFHKKGIIHRDLKTRNILIHEEKGRLSPKITDFGLGRILGEDPEMMSTIIALTPPYAAPEQIEQITTGTKVGMNPNVDLWALGVLIYRMAANELPFDGNRTGATHQDPVELRRKILEVELPEKLNTLPEPYQTIIRRCLVKDVKQRAQTADELLQLLDNQVGKGITEPINDPNKTDIITPNPQPQPTPTPIKPSVKPPQPTDNSKADQRMIWKITGISLAVLLALFFWNTPKPSEPKPPKPPPVDTSKVQSKLDSAPTSATGGDTFRPNVNPEPIETHSEIDDMAYFSKSINEQLAKDASISGLSFIASFRITSNQNVDTIYDITNIEANNNALIRNKKSLVEAALKRLSFGQSPTMDRKKCNFKYTYEYQAVAKPTSTDVHNMVNTTKPVGDTPKRIIDDSIDPKAYDYEMVDNKDYFFQAINEQLARDKSVASLSFRAEFVITPSKNIGPINWIDDLKKDRNKPLIEAALRKLRFEQSPKVRGNGGMCFFKMIYHKGIGNK